MYSIEYIWTKNEINVTTSNIEHVKLSKQKDHSIFKISTKNQEPIDNFKTVLLAKTSTNKKNEKQKDKNTLIVVMKQVPLPKKRPNKLPLKKPSKGKKIIKSNIKIIKIKG